MDFFHAWKEVRTHESIHRTLEFPSSIKDKILKDISKINTEFISGKYIHVENTNLSICEPHKIIFSNASNYFVLINYENDSTLYDKETMNFVTLEMIKFVMLKLAKK